MMHVSQIISLYTLNLIQLYCNKKGREKLITIRIFVLQKVRHKVWSLATFAMVLTLRHVFQNNGQ